MSGVPVGYPHTQDGAKAAAANYTVVSGSADFLANPYDRDRAVSAMAAQGTADAAEKKADLSAAQAIGALQGDNPTFSVEQAIARTGVLSARVLGYDDRGPWSGCGRRRSAEARPGTRRRALGTSR